MSEGPDVIDQILQTGEHDPEALVAAQKKAAVESLEIARNINDTFGTPAGQASLLWLRKMTIEQPSFVPGVSGGSDFSGLDAVHQGFVREGQNSIYRQIVRMMEFAQSPPPELLAIIEGDSK